MTSNDPEILEKQWFTVEVVEELDEISIYMADAQMKLFNLDTAGIVMLKSAFDFESLNLVLNDNEMPKDLIRMGQATSYNLRAKNRDKIRVIKCCDLPEGESINVVPLMDTLRDYTGNVMDDLLEPYFRNKFYPLRNDNIFEVHNDGRNFQFHVTRTNPTPYCIVTSKTIIEFDNTPVQLDSF